MHFDINILKMKRYPFNQMPVVILLLQQYNFRISEVLRLNIDCLVHPFHIIVKLSKSTDYFVIADKNIFDVLLDIFSHTFNKGFTVNYDKVYRFIRDEMPEYVLRTENKKCKVTHAFRYINANNFSSNLKNEQQIKALLRHKSRKTQKYYLKKTTP